MAVNLKSGTRVEILDPMSRGLFRLERGDRDRETKRDPSGIEFPDGSSDWDQWGIDNLCAVWYP